MSPTQAHLRDAQPEQVARAQRLEHEGRFAEAAAIWEAAAAAAAGRTRAEALAEQARVVAERLGDAEGAIRLHRRALVNDPTLHTSLDALLDDARRRGSWLRLALLTRLRFEAARTPGERVALALEAGRLQIERLENPGGARAWLAAGLAVDPASVALHEALADVERARRDDDALLAVLERTAQLPGDHVSPATLLEAATLRSERGDHDAALAHLDHAAQIAPDDALVLDALAEALAQSERHSELADVLERRAAIALDDPAGRAGTLVELAELYEDQLFDPDAALDAYRRACAADASAPGARDGIARLGAKAEDGDGRAAVEAPPEVDPQTLLHQYEQEAGRTADRAELGRLVREIGALHEQLGTPEAALPWVQRWVRLAPEEPEALRALSRLYARPGYETELCATLEVLDRFLPPAEQADNRLRLGGIYVHRGVHDDAVRAFERSLEIRPDNLEALEGLVWVQREAGRIPELITAQWRLAEQLEPPRRAAVLASVALLQEENGDLAGAIATRFWMERDGGPGALEEEERLDDLLERAGRLDELSQRLETRAASFEPERPEAIQLELRRGDLLLRAPGREDDAAELYRSILERAPDDADARAGLERALRAGIDAAGLAEFLADQAASAPDPETRERSALERAVLLEDLLSRSDEACAVYRDLASSAALAEVRREAGLRYEGLLEQAGDWLQLRAHLEGRADCDDALERTRIHERLAALCADRLRDEGGELYHLERLVALDPARGDVWRRLAQRYEQAGRREDWLRASQAELDAHPEPNRELTLHARLAESRVESGDLETAAHHYGRVFELNPAHTTAAGFLVARYREEGRPEDMLRVLEARLATLGAPSDGDADGEAEVQRTALRLQIAEVHDRELRDLEGAISALEVALSEAGPTSPVALPLASCYARAGYALDLIQLCREAADASGDDAERANWLVRLGDANLERGETQEAADAYQRALSHRPDDRALQASLRELHRQHGERRALAQLLEGELTHLAGAEEIPVRMELAELLGEPGSQRAADALNHTRRVLQLEPGHTDAFEQGVALASRLGQPDTALALIEARCTRARNDAERSDLEARRARILAGLGPRADEAIAAFERALACAVDPRPLRAELAELLEREGRHEGLLALRSAACADLASGERVDAIERGIALAADKLSLDATLPWLASLRQERPSDAQVVGRIAEVHRAAGREASLLQALDEQARLEPRGARRRALHLERAKLLEARGERGRAAHALMDAAEAAPSDPHILEELARVQDRLGWHAERARTLATLLELPQSDQLALHRELASLCEGPLADPARAGEHLRAALPYVPARSPQAVELLRDLGRCLRALGRVEEWAVTCERELAALGHAPVFDERRRELQRALAAGYDRELGRPDDALRHLRALLDRGGAGGDELARLEGDCLRLLRAAGDSVELEHRLAAHLERAGGPGPLWLELAALREQQLHAHAGAMRAYQRALECMPESRSALRGLRRTAEYLGRWSDVADALQRELDHEACADGSERAALLRRLGDVCWHRLESTTRASRCYAAATEANPRDFASLRALERLLEAMEDWASAADLYESEIEVLGEEDPARTREAWVRIASIADEQLQDVPRARDAYARAAAISPLRRQRLLRSAELHERAGDLDAFAEAFATWCDAEDTSSQADDHLRLASCLAELGRPEAALTRVQKALDVEPSLARAWALAARLEEDLGDPAAAAESLGREAMLLPDAEAGAALLRAARLVEPEDPARALELVRTAVERHPGHPAAHAARACLALAQAHPEEAFEAAGRALSLPVDDGLSADQLVTVACVGGDAARISGDLDAAAALYRRALEEDSDCDRAAGAQGETLAALGDYEGARRVLEARLAREDDYPERAQHATTLGECLEGSGAFEEALTRYEAALAIEPRLDEALEGAVRVREALGQVDEGIAAIERWAAATPYAAEVGSRLLRAALWEREAGGRGESAERHLRAALRADPQQPAGWIALASQLFESRHYDEAALAVDRAAPYATDRDELASLALLQAHAREAAGDRRGAAESFALAWEADPSCTTAALAHARLLRGFGEWREAAAALERVITSHPDPESPDLAELHEQLGRLQAGPLEQIEAAIASYRRAVHRDPERAQVRTALAELLSHRPDDWDEALFHHRIVLAADPTNVPALRVALRVARGRNSERSVADGLRILRALGVAAPHELEAWRDGKLAFATGSGALEDPLQEKLRQLIAAVSTEIASALGSPPGHAEEPQGNDEARFRAEVLEAAGSLTSPAILTLETTELQELAGLLAALALEAEEIRGDGRLVNALSSTLRRRQRRRLRRILDEATAEQIESIDFDAWRNELRALAAWTALRRGVASLRTALVALVRDVHEGLDDPLRDDADLAELVASTPVARALLRRIAFDWLDGMR